MENRKPKQVKNYPENGEMKYLFRKKLKDMDTKTLLLVQESTKYFPGFPESRIAQMNGGIFEVMLYTPKADPTPVFIKRKQVQTTTYHLKQAEWRAVLGRNEFEIGDEIDCWAIYNASAAHADEGQCLSLVIEKGNRVHLFRKTLTQSDLLSLEIVQPLLEGLSLNLRRELNDGVEVVWFTPVIAGIVDLKREQSGYITYNLRHKGWCNIAGVNRWITGQRIDCWCLFDSDATDLDEALTLIIQGVTIISSSS
ncbi:hypothetical protein OWV82_008859 [Melia azedarach]|uniref:Uncharacterized protein n=1 Tax=Melia azedarach TaxID=155640 RepID=A0ACC1YCR3_MELAZ|nr:hypothetical protein OWV82_008859 [Melia azedarach]